MNINIRKSLLKKIILILIIVYFGYLLKNYLSSRSIFIVYPIVCDRNSDNECVSEYKFAIQKIIFKVNENAQTVLYKSKDESFKKLDKCQVWNINNWKCQVVRDEKISQVNGYLAVKNGVFTSTPPEKDKECYIDLSKNDGFETCHLTDSSFWDFPIYGESGGISKLNWQRLFCHNKGILENIKCWFSY